MKNIKIQVIFQKPTKDNIIFQNIVTKIIAATIVIVLQNYINIDVLTDNIEYFMPGRVFQQEIVMIVLQPCCQNLIDFCIRIEFFDPQQFVLSTYNEESFTTEIEEVEIYVGEEEVFLTNLNE